VCNGGFMTFSSKLMRWAVSSASSPKRSSMTVSPLALPPAGPGRSWHRGCRPLRAAFLSPAACSRCLPR
jgi:hypothetical protein